MGKLSITDLELAGRRVLVRVDFNVPLQNGEIGDDTRIRAAVPTVQYILERGGVPILMSHLGRPNGRAIPELSLKPAAERLGELLGREVLMAPDCVGPEVEALAKRADGVVLLENLRFHAAEEANDPEFACQLCELGSAFVNDAFGTAHRAHASTEGVTHHFVDCAAGFLMQRELDSLEKALSAPARPFVAVMGGAKISGKIDVIQHLLSVVDTLLIGGGMAYTFFKAMGLEIGRSLLEVDRQGMAEILLQRAAAAEVRLLLPTDCVVASEAREGRGVTGCATGRHADGPGGVRYRARYAGEILGRDSERRIRGVERTDGRIGDFYFCPWHAGGGARRCGGFVAWRHYPRGRRRNGSGVDDMRSCGPVGACFHGRRGLPGIPGGWRIAGRGCVV